VTSVPRIAVTLGDPAGIGPEIVVRAVGDAGVLGKCDPVVVGDRAVFDAAARACAIPSGAPNPDFVDLNLCDQRAFGAGRIDAHFGEASYRYLAEAIRMAMDGEVEAIVTGPVNKAAWHAAGHAYPGQTEVVAEATGGTKYAMMLAAGSLRSILVTTHVALRDVPGLVSSDNIAARIRLAHRVLPAFIGKAPRVGVAGLNPHAGEGGLFGAEESDIIAPAVALCRAEGIDVTGPWPADTLYVHAADGRYDGVIAMYHDQGLIPVKLLDMHGGINVTLGLPIIRTSPDHGTAFDIVGRRVAKPTSLIAAIDAAAQLVGAR
jgi:4-hydroxythreonine-4-phosphate dehydrogenase